MVSSPDQDARHEAVRQRDLLVRKICVAAVAHYQALGEYLDVDLDGYVVMVGAAFHVTRQEATRVLNMRVRDLIQIPGKRDSIRPVSNPDDPT
jgi:hypothetical protein